MQLVRFADFIHCYLSGLEDRAGPHTAWPSLPDVIGAARTRRPYHRYRYKLLLALTVVQRRRLLLQLDEHPDWRQIFLEDPNNFYVFFRRYLDRRWSMLKRFEKLSTDLEVAACKFGPDVTGLLARRHSVRLCEMPGFSVDLTINKPTRIEGFWALSLNDSDNRQLFNLSFGFTGRDSVLIASVQGIKRPEGGSIEVIRGLTKQTNGLRPHSLLLEVFRMACTCWEIRQIEGIDSKHQVTKYKKKEDEFKFDYRAYWQEHGAQRLADGGWLLEGRAKRRSREETPPHKRAMYRKRYELLDELGILVANGLKTARIAPVPSFPAIAQRPTIDTGKPA